MTGSRDPQDNPCEVDGAFPPLAELFNEDQEDRRRFFQDYLDPEEIVQRDKERQKAVQKMLKRRLVRTGVDYYHVAMILHHSASVEDIDLAHELAKKAIELTAQAEETQEAAKWLVAATFDRSRMKRGMPQWYGTQFFQDQEGGPWVLYDVDEAALTDAERRRMNVPTLEQARAQAAQMNDRRRKRSS
jgi:hypothetical protein